MKVHCFFLLVLVWPKTSEGVELENYVLRQIVNTFTWVAWEGRTAGGGQFSFLIWLNTSQCTGEDQNIHYIPNTNGLPCISAFPTFPLGNYLAVYPSTHNSNQGRRCSESKLLHNPPDAARQYQMLMNNPRQGCIILYTTYTPCTNTCFSDDQNYAILPALSRDPFSAPWNTANNIHKYFVFSELYGRDRDNVSEVRAKLANVANVGFNIRRCERNQNMCETCHYDNSYCLERKIWDPRFG